jgi:hypothetical protein
MELPNCEKAIIFMKKLMNYLLSDTHEVGKSKAKFFYSIRFNKRNVNLFKKELSRLTCEEEVKDTIHSDYGVKYIIDGTIVAPYMEKANLRTVWVIEKGEGVPRFITAYPI